MKNIKVIFKKELKDMLRDRRTLIFMILFPLLFVPLIVAGLPKLISSISEKNFNETLTLAVVGESYAPELINQYRETENLIVVTNVPVDSINQRISDETIDGAIVIYEEFKNNLQNMIPVQVDLYFRSSDDLDAKKRRFEKVLLDFSDTIKTNRYEVLNLDQQIFTPIEIRYNNIASQKERIGKSAGGWLPYLFILYCFMGAMYPALDLGAGEKERKTLETILVSPASRLEILLGKFGVITTFGLLSAIMGLIGLSIGINFMDVLPEEIHTVLKDMLDFKTIGIILTLVVPVAIFFAAILLSISLYGRTYKEAQSLIAPLNIVVIFPAVIGTIPGIKFNAMTAAIPIVNISLATKEVIAGTIEIPLLFEVYLSLLILAGLAIFLAVKMFNNENVIFRG
ncbi:MAG: ABC transporter permease [Candidatus Marinimicrobia bacterium]|nr:ABC transporter permease [Candidatus Neomarinimicrobiota bacterium]